MMSAVRVTGESPGAPPRPGCAQLGRRTKFLPAVLFEQLVEERGSLRRQISAVAHTPSNLGVGIDEATAAVVRGEAFAVFGSSTVTMVDSPDPAYTNLSDLDRSRPLAICGVKIHLLSAGGRFDLARRAPVPPA